VLSAIVIQIEFSLLGDFQHQTPYFFFNEGSTGFIWTRTIAQNLAV